MATASRILLADRVLLALGVIAWLMGVGGYLCARAFVSDALAPRAVMSPRTFTQVTLISVGWWLSVVVLALALVPLAISRGFRTSTLLPTVLVSALYVLPLGFVALFGRHLHG
jgi:hypothetical protein